jgi:hypothetical protein
VPLERMFASPTIAELEERIIEAQLAQFDLGELERIATGAGISTATGAMTAEDR